MKKREKQNTQIVMKHIMVLIASVIIIVLCTSCSENEREGFIGVKQLKISLNNFEMIQEEDAKAYFHTHENTVERSFYQSDDSILMFEQIDNLTDGTRTYLCIDSLVQEDVTHERYAFALGSGRGRIIDSIESKGDYHCYVAILDESKGCAFIVECYSNDKNIADSLKRGFEKVLYYGIDYTCEMEDVKDKYPQAFSVSEARKHSGEVVTVKGEKYSYGWTVVGIGDGNTLLQIDGAFDNGGLGVHMTMDEDVQRIPSDCLGFLEGTVYVRGTIVVNYPNALIWLKEDDSIICDYETYIYHDILMGENSEYEKVVKKYEERDYELQIN